MSTTTPALRASITTIAGFTGLFCAAPLIGQEGAGTITYTEHVAPILLQNCASCHRPGEVAPFPLLTYKDAKRRGRMIRRVTKSRFMPPWHPVAGHGSFVGANRLSAAQIGILDAWVKGGMPEGDPDQMPPLPKFTDGWQLGTPDLVVKMPRGYEVPAGGPDIYRNFVVPLDLDEDKWVTAIEVRPGARAVLHHVIFGIDTFGQARRQDGRDGKPGFRGMRGGGRDGTSTAGLGGWAVGGQPRHLPMGLARKVPKGADIVLRSHFHPSGKKEVEQTTIGLYFTDKAPTRTMVGLQLPPAFGIGAGLDIPAGEANFTLRDSFVLPVDALALTVGGHAHYICKKMQVFATPPGGEKKSIFYIDDWAFNWQNRYQYEQPLALRRGTKIDVVITYDNSSNNPSNPFDPPKRVRWGLQSTDEMGSVTLLMVARRERDAGRLKRAIRSASGESMRRNASLGGLLGGVISQIKMLDQNGDGKIEASEVPARYKRWVERLDTNRDGVLDEKEIESIGNGFRRR